ncbi:MAG: family 1 encapsulin nanocompartment shell protein [Pseudomonadota bacterium]
MSFGFLMRADAPFGEEVWSAIDGAVVQAARQMLVGRRFLPFTGPLGEGARVVPLDSLAEAGGAGLSIFGNEDAPVAALSARCWVQLPLLYKDFRLEWRDIEALGQRCAAGDVNGPAYAAGAACARLEDNLIFNGSEPLGLPGLLNVKGRLEVKGGDLKTPGKALSAVSQAMARLIQNESFEPYALALNPEVYAGLFSVHPGTARLEIEILKERCQAGVFQSSVIPDGQGVVVSVAPHQLDLVVGLDVVTGYLGPEKMNHGFRVMETVAPRIKKPTAVCAVS